MAKAPPLVFEELYLVYKTTHIPSGRFYIGRHKTRDLDDGYLGSGTIISRLLRAHPRNEFIREILHFAANGDEMLDVEEQFIKEVLDHPLCLNCTVGDPNKRGIVHHSIESKKRMSEAQKGRVHSEESKLKISLAKLGKFHSPETREKIKRYAQDRTIAHRVNHRTSLRLRWQEKRDEWIESFQKRPPVSITTRKKMSGSHAGEKNVRALSWILEREDGSTYVIKSLKTWCIQQAIKYTSLLYTERSNTFYDGYRVRRVS